MVLSTKQIEKLKKKIAGIKNKLAAEKRKIGTYDDGRGLRYLPTKYFIQLQDYSGGLKYIGWFYKNFPDDSGFPEFLFECIIILFKTGKLKEAKRKAFETFRSNTYLFDKFFERKIIPIKKSELSNLEQPQYTIYFDYSYKQIELSGFAEWLNNFIQSEKFIKASTKFIDLQKKLENEHDHETRSYLLKASYQLTNEF